VGAKGEGNASVRGGEVVGVGGDGVLFSVVGVLSEHLGSDHATGTFLSQVEQFLGKFRV